MWVNSQTFRMCWRSETLKPQTYKFSRKIGNNFLSPLALLANPCFHSLVNRSGVAGAVLQSPLCRQLEPGGLKTSSQRRTKNTFFCLKKLGFENVFGLGILFWWTSLLCIVGELAGGGSLAVAFGFGDRLQVTHDTLHYTRSKGKSKKYVILQFSDQVLIQFVQYYI